MVDEFYDPVWEASKKGGRIIGTLCFVAGFFGPPLLVALALAFPNFGGDGDIGVFFPFVGIVLGPLGYITGGLVGMAVGWLIGMVRCAPNYKNPNDPQFNDSNEHPIAKP